MVAPPSHLDLSLLSFALNQRLSVSGQTSYAADLTVPVLVTESLYVSSAGEPDATDIPGE
jgi:hypothetical protein